MVIWLRIKVDITLFRQLNLLAYATDKTGSIESVVVDQLETTSVDS